MSRFQSSDSSESAAVGHSRGRGLLKFSSGSPSPSGLNTRPPGQVHWVSEQWSPPVLASSPSPVNPPGLLLRNNETGSQGTPVFSISPLGPSYSTPALSLHSKDAAGQHAFGTPVSADLSPSAVTPRSPGKRPEVHSTTVNGDIPLMTSASDPLPVPLHVFHAAPIPRSLSPSLCIPKPARASPHHINIHQAQQNSVPYPSPRSPTMSPVHPAVPVSLVSWPSSVSGAKSPHIASAMTQSSGTQSVKSSAMTQSSVKSPSALSPLAPLFVPQHCSADNKLLTEASAMESIRRVIGSLANANTADDIELEKLQLGQLMSRITNVLSLQCITDELVTQSVENENFRYTGARLCAFLSQNLVHHSVSFWKMLLQRCYTDFANHRQMVLSADGLVNLINYTLFIAELMLAHKNTSGFTHEVFPRFLTQIMMTLLSMRNSQSYTCVVRVLKLCGPALDDTDFYSSVDEIFEGLRQAIVDDSTGRSLRALMLSVVEQRAARWGSLVAGMPAAGTQQVSAGEDQYGAHVEGNAPRDQQSAVDNTSYDLPSPVLDFVDGNGISYYIDMDSVHSTTTSEEGYGDWSGADYLLNSSILSEEDALMQDDEEMDPEIAAAYEQFLEEMMQNETGS